MHCNLTLAPRTQNVKRLWNEWMKTEWMNHIALAANTMQDSSWKPLRQSYRQGVDGSQRLKLELEWMEVSIVPPGSWVTLGTWTSLYFSVLKYKADTIMAPATKGRCEWLSVSVLAWTHISGLRSIRTTYLQERVQLTPVTKMRQVWYPSCNGRHLAFHYCFHGGAFQFDAFMWGQLCSSRINCLLVKRICGPCLSPWRQSTKENPSHITLPGGKWALQAWF